MYLTHNERKSVVAERFVRTLGVENNEEDPKFEVGDDVKISKYKNICAKVYAPN